MKLRCDGRWPPIDGIERTNWTILEGPAVDASFITLPGQDAQARALEMAALYGACSRCGVAVAGACRCEG